jgi:uncharacterized protein
MLHIIGSFRRRRGLMRLKKLIILIGEVVLMCLFLYLNNNMLSVSNITITSPKIPNGFKDYKIVHISDLHSKSFGKDQKNIISKIDKLKPDIIVITGDIIDRKKYNEENSIIFVREAIKIAPVYYCTGNHEAWSGKFEVSLENRLADEGVSILNDTSKVLSKSGEKINIIGVQDPAFNTNGYLESYKNSDIIEGSLKKATELIDRNEFNMLLSHRPELIDVYVKNKIDLVFSGHAHGGQIRLPFIGGILSPNQGIFPKYTSGLYKKEWCNLIVSRGLGNSVFPFRIFNRPHIICVTLKSEEQR